MTTNFPTSVDAFTNPTSNDTLDNPPHDQQHADINDAMEAVQTSLLDGSPLKIDDANNRVGIGTTSPDRGLHVDSPTAAVSAKFTTQHASLGLVELADSSSTVTSQIGTNGNDIVFRPIQTERMRIDSSGNVGINDSTPSYKLDVNGDINTTGRIRISGYPTMGGAIYCYTAGYTSTWGSTWYSRDWTITAPSGTQFASVVFTSHPIFSFRHSIVTVKSASSSSITFALSSYGGACDGYVRWVSSN